MRKFAADDGKFAIDMTIPLPSLVAQLLCSRLCHDLISPVGAISNGLEFLAEGDSRLTADAISLVGGSASQAAARLTFYRLAFGQGDGSAPPIPLLDARDIARNFIGDGKVDLDWPVPSVVDNQDLSRPFGKLLLNLFLMALDALPRAGQIAVMLPMPPSEKWINIVARGDRCELRDEFRAVLRLDPPEDALSARNINGYLATQMAADLGLRIEIDGEFGEAIEISALS